MTKYIIANRRAGKFGEMQKKAARASVEAAFATILSGVDVIGDNKPDDETARRVLVVQTDPATIAAMPKDPDVLVEPEILHYSDTHRPAGFLNGLPLSGFVAASNLQKTINVQVVSAATKNGLNGAEVLVFLQGPGGIRRQLTQRTAANGRTQFAFPSIFQASALVAVPAGGHWSMVVRAPQLQTLVTCPPLPDGPHGWWHRILGDAVEGGDGIRVGVADTGLGPNAALAHVVDVGAFINGIHLPGHGADVDSHGTHVCGTIGARPVSLVGYEGIAAEAQLFSARVFGPGEGANQGDIANAIDELSRTHQVDLINLSLGSTRPSEIERDAIRDALERGTLCICAAANSAGPVEFPAAFPECVAVSALGFLGSAPDGSLSSTRLPVAAGAFGSDNLYLANFSCFGPNLDCAGPGVGIIATVPERFGLVEPYAAMDGTSMASPAVCAATAVLLSRDADYQALARDAVRAERARSILLQNCRTVGLASDLEGRGIPAI